MKIQTENAARRNQIIAGLLWYGTLLACALIAMGMILNTAGSAPVVFHFTVKGYDLVRAGVAVLILLPVLRVLVMLLIFARERDAVYVAIAALVLIIIGAGIAFEI